MIVTGRGLNVFPAEVENALLTHPATHDVAVAGVETGDGLAVKAWVVLARGSDASAVELRRHCSERLASFKVPKQIRFVDEIPRNPMNKVLRAELG
jgi:acyl-coenzyme A synthetase/AMP-(fatty) acid ligase